MMRHAITRNAVILGLFAIGTCLLYTSDDADE